MSKLEELNLNLFNILSVFTHSQNLCKLLYYDGLNPLDEVDILNPHTLLMYKKIFPLPKVPNTDAVASSMLAVFYDDIRPGTQNPGFKNSSICIHVLCHIDQWKVDGGIRPYLIMSEVDKVLNNQRVSGLGKMQLERAKFINVNNIYSGYSMYYNIVDFN